MVRQQIATPSPDAGAAYARALYVAARLALGLLGLAYGVYIFFGPGLDRSPDAIAASWSLPASEQARMLAETGGWTSLLDLFPHACVMFIASISLGCMILLAVTCARRRSTLQFRLALLQALVFCLAMSGLGDSMF